MNSNVMDQRVSALEKEVAYLKNRLAQIKHPLPDAAIPDGFTEYEGGLFQKKLVGGYRKIIFCPVCWGNMTPASSRTYFICRWCLHEASFPGMNLNDIVDKLNKR